MERRVLTEADAAADLAGVPRPPLAAQPEAVEVVEVLRANDEFRMVEFDAPVYIPRNCSLAIISNPPEDFAAAPTEATQPPAQPSAAAELMTRDLWKIAHAAQDFLEAHRVNGPNFKGRARSEEAFRAALSSTPPAQQDAVDAGPSDATDALRDVVACFNAAEVEGLQEALNETPDERLKDLVTRRLMHAKYYAEEAIDRAAISAKKGGA